MSDFIYLFGALNLILGVVIFFRPNQSIKLFRKSSDPSSVHALTVVIRLIFGLALVTYASESKYPLILQIFGWLSIITAIIFTVMGHRRFKDFIAWMLRTAVPFMRFAGGVSVFLGGFLIYAVT